jgi:xylulokinase
MDFIGIDVGTSSVKVLRTNEAGTVVATASRSYPLEQPCVGWTQQHPADWWRATVEAIRAVSGTEPIGGIGLSGQMHGLVLIDEIALKSDGSSDEVIRPAILWNDQRTADECAEIESALGGREACVNLTGNAALAGFTLPKLLWVRKHEPELFSRAVTFMMPKDYIRWRLTGVVATDVGDASGTLLFEPTCRRWSETAARTFGIPHDFLPTVLESGSVCGQVTPQASKLIGIKPGVPVITGSGDNMMGAIGAGIVAPGTSIITIGTSGVVYSHTATYAIDVADPAAPGRVHSMCAADGNSSSPGGWCVTGCTLASGGSLAWAKESVWPETSYEQLLHEASLAPSGCEGLSFLPCLTGERCPYPNPRARGAWVGLTSVHNRGHMVRSILEGVAATLATIVAIQRSAGIHIDRFRIGGGGARIALWRSILANELGTAVSLPNTEEGPAFGAALLAIASQTRCTDIRAICGALVRDTLTIEPGGGPSGNIERLNACYHALHTRPSHARGVAP